MGTDKHSCPTGFKIWSPRNKNDFTAVYNAMGKNINNYPRKPHLIVDVTRPANGCGGCTKYAMKSGVSQQGSWKTTDGSNWWLRDGRYNEPNGDYHANCYLHIYDVNPNNVRFNDGNCGHVSSAYLCQKAEKKLNCGPSSPSNCKITKLNVPGYSAGLVVRVDNGRAVRRSTEKHSCPTGFKIWSPRNKNDFTAVYNAMGKNINNYPRKPHLIVDVTRPANGCGGCTKYAMKSTTSEQGSWKTSDGSAWWLRDSRYNEPNGDYHANCYLHIYDVNPNNVRFNDGSCAYYSTEYLCQKVKKKQQGKKYSYAGNGKTNCGKNKPVASEAACKQAAKTVKKAYGGTGSYAAWPKFCFVYNNKLYFNKHKTGKANKQGNPVCAGAGGGKKTTKKQGQAKTVVAYQTPDTRSGCPRSQGANQAL